MQYICINMMFLHFEKNISCIVLYIICNIYIYNKFKNIIYLYNIYIYNNITCDTYNIYIYIKGEKYDITNIFYTI